MKRRRPNRAKLALFAIALTAAFMVGGASALLFVYLHPIDVQLQTTSACIFRLPDQLFQPL